MILRKRLPLQRSCPACLFLPLVLLAGCAETSNEVLIAGTVTQAGEPISSAAIMFFPSQGRPTSATIDSRGSYKCSVAPGDYRVTITPSVVLPTGWKEGDPVPQIATTIPMRYTSRAKTPLQATVTAESAGPVDFSLE